MKERIKKIKLKKDFIIPAGTVLNDIGGLEAKYGSGNYECIVGMTDNTWGSFVYSFDVDDEDDPILEEIDDWFEAVD